MIDATESDTAKSQIKIPLPLITADPILPNTGIANHDAAYRAKPVNASISVEVRLNASAVPRMTNSDVMRGESGASTYEMKHSTPSNIVTRMARLNISPRLRIQFGMCMVVGW